MQTKTKIIDGHSVEITPLGFLEASSLKRTILKPILNMIDKDVFSGLSELFETVDDKEYKRLSDLIMKNCAIGGEYMGNGAYDAFFSGKTALFYKVVGFFLEVNYGDFLELAKVGLEKVGLTTGDLTSVFKGSSPITTMSSKKK